jgi:hypothetical protein
MVESKAKENEVPTVKVDGEEAVLHITDESVMFERGGKVSGFLRSAIQMIKPDGDTMLIAYTVGNEVKSVRIEPITALTPLLTHGPQKDSSLRGITTSPTAALDEVFEKLYRDARRELEERLAKVMEEPQNNSLRLTPEEEKRYSEVFGQMMRIIRTKHGIDEDDPSHPLATWSLHEQPYPVQLEVIKAEHILFLHEIAGSRAENADIGYTATGIWPRDMERILVRYKLIERPFLTTEFKNYLKSKWKRPENKRKPVIANLS